MISDRWFNDHHINSDDDDYDADDDDDDGDGDGDGDDHDYCKMIVETSGWWSDVCFIVHPTCHADPFWPGERNPFYWKAVVTDVLKETKEGVYSWPRNGKYPRLMIG